jgi:serine/threonine protein kinase/WD40 repeat protein/tetratricopeptide (TPR) repeat protein
MTILGERPMSELSSERNPVEALAEEFLERYRRGERPPLSEYTDKHPALAAEIRDLFPALLMMEDVRPGGEDATGAYGAEASLVEGKNLERVGDYRILREVGRGGMGIVYEAEQESLGRHVALKVLPAHSLLDPQRLRRFQREAKAAARLHHTNIVPVFGVGEDEGLHYYVMQFIQGQGLDEVLVELKRLRQAKSISQREFSVWQKSTLPSERASEIAHGLLSGQFEFGPKQVLREGEALAEPVSGAGRDAHPTAQQEPRPPASSASSPLREEGASRERKRPECSALSDSGIHLPGQPAHTTLSDSGLSYWRGIARIGIQVAEALTYAHSQGTLHRDIKPSNLLLDTQGTVWITDFGLAKAVESDDLTRTGDIVGTIRYMAPERFQGRSDARSDVYGLGITLYELLTLRPAFEESDRVRLVQRVTQLDPPPPRRLDRRIPRDLETIVLKAIAKEQEKRYQSAAEFTADLKRFAEDKPIRARRVSAPERLWRWTRRNPALAWLTGSVAAALLVVAIVSSVSAIWLKEERDRAVTAERNLGQQFEKTDKQRQRAEEAEEKGRLDLGQSLLAEGTANQRSGLAGQRFTSLDLLGQATTVLRSHPQGEQYLSKARDQAISALGLTDLRAQRPRPIGAVMSVCCDARLERYAIFEFGTRDLVVRRMADDGELLRLPPPALPFWYAHPGFSPDGRYLIAEYRATGGADNMLRVWRLGNKEPIFSQAFRPTGWAFHPDGRRLLFCHPQGGLAIWDLEAGREVKRLPLDLTMPYCLCLASDGRRVAVNNDWDSGHPQVKLLDLETGREVASWTSQVGRDGMAWSADGRLLATGCSDDGRIYVWDVPRGQLASVLQGHTSRVTRCEFAHASHLLATSSWDGTTRLWDAASGEALASTPGALEGSFSADDRWLPFYSNANLGVWEVAHGTHCRTLHPGMVGNRTENSGASGQVEGADFSPDGRLLALSGGDGVRLYDTATGLELYHLPVGGCDSVLFHPDGHSLFTSGGKALYCWPICQTGGVRGSPDPAHGVTEGLPGRVPRSGDRATTERDGEWRVGPPQMIKTTGPNGWQKATWMPGHLALAVLDNPNACVWLIDVTGSPSRPGKETGGAGRLENQQPAALPSEHHRMTSIAISPDGRWAAAGGWKEWHIQVWNVAERRVEKVLTPGDGGGEQLFFVAFSSDGRWLVSYTNNDEAPGYYFWRVDTWERGLFIPCPSNPGLSRAPAFTADGRMMALRLTPRQILLADVATGRTIAHLSTLQPLSATPLAFSADGTHLAASTNQRTVLLWDLRAIRKELAEMGLDWAQPTYLPAEPASSPRTLAVKVDLGDLLVHQKSGGRRSQEDLQNSLALWSTSIALSPYHPESYHQRGHIYEQLGRSREAIADFTAALRWQPKDAKRQAHLLSARGQSYWRLKQVDLALADLQKALDLDPDNAELCNSLAWFYVTAPEKQRDPRKALPLAKKALASPARHWTYWNTLGVVYYRLGQYEAAIVALERSQREGQGAAAAFDLLFLAMCYSRLNDSPQAKICYEQAIKWLQERESELRPQWQEELTEFRAEAEAVLDIKEK